MCSFLKHLDTHSLKTATITNTPTKKTTENLTVKAFKFGKGMTKVYTGSLANSCIWNFRIIRWIINYKTIQREYKYEHESGFQILSGLFFFCFFKTCYILYRKKTSLTIKFHKTQQTGSALSCIRRVPKWTLPADTLNYTETSWTDTWLFSLISHRRV